MITFAQTTDGKLTQKMYKNYERELSEELSGVGQDIEKSDHYTAEECVKGINGAQRTYDLGSGVELEILEHKFYYVVYQTEAFLYSNTDLIRTVEVVRVEDDGQAE